MNFYNILSYCKVDKICKMFVKVIEENRKFYIITGHDVFDILKYVSQMKIKNILKGFV